MSRCLFYTEGKKACGSFSRRDSIKQREIQQSAVKTHLTNESWRTRSMWQETPDQCGMMRRRCSDIYTLRVCYCTRVDISGICTLLETLILMHLRGIIDYFWIFLQFKLYLFWGVILRKEVESVLPLLPESSSSHPRICTSTWVKTEWTFASSHHILHIFPPSEVFIL